MINRIRGVVACMLLLAVGFTAQAQRTDYASIVELRRMVEGVAEVRPTSDGEHFTELKMGEIVKRSYRDADFKEVLYSAPMGDFAISDYSLSPDEKSILISQGAHPIYRHSFTTSYHLSGERGTSAILHNVEATRDASFSPNSKMLAFSSLNNLYLYDIESQKVTQVTADGEWNKVINGTTDWVYEEEFGFTRAYWFSPDSEEIAYLRFDESQVPTFEIMRYDNKLYNKSYSFKYPKAGDANSEVELWIYNIASGESRLVESGKGVDQYIPYVGYTPAGKAYYYRLNRKQNHLEVVLVEKDGASRTIYEESSPRYVERVSASTITFVDDERFIVREETSKGFMHLYLYSVANGCLGAITKGDWEVTSLLAVDDTKVYYSSTEQSPLERAIYSVDFNGKHKRKLSGKRGYYSARPSASMKYYISSYTNSSTPSYTAVYDNKGKFVRELANNDELKAVLDKEQMPVKEFFTFKTERGDKLNGYILRPRDFDKRAKYPVLLTQYSGPGSQQVADRWSLDWENALVESGYIVVCADGRGTGFRGEEFKKCTYANLGDLEVQDQISLAKYMADQSYVDAERIGIYGWSYGGFMSLNCALKSEGLFKMAIAVAPVTSWRYYDTIYTEIYNGLPGENPEGYDNNSPINFAEQLDDRTKLLIIHGTADDNVHFQNTMEMTRALNKHGKRYDMMIYPDQNHSMMPNDMGNVRQKMIDYTLRNL